MVSQLGHDVLAQAILPWPNLLASAAMSGITSHVEVRGGHGSSWETDPAF